MSKFKSKDALSTTSPFEAAEKGDFDSLWWLMSVHGMNFDVQNDDGDTAAHCAVRGGQMENLKWLMINGARRDVLNKRGRAPAHLAALHGSLDALQMCLSDEVLDLGDADGDAPVHLAARGGYISCMTLLIERGADLDARNAAGRTAAHVAAEAGHLELIKVLISNSASIAIADQDGVTAQDIAKRNEHRTMSKYLQSVHSLGARWAFVYRWVPGVVICGSLVDLCLALVLGPMEEAAGLPAADMPVSSSGRRSWFLVTIAMVLLRVLAGVQIQNAMLYVLAACSFAFSALWIVSETLV